MIEIGRHIEILLLSNDCVIVPDFGGFMTHHVDARYDDGDNMCLPPLRTLGFNPQLTMNDSLLAQSYIEAYDISYPEAIKKIDDEVRELKQHLDNEGSFELNDIGTIHLNPNGNYEFEPCEAGLLTPDLYGLSSFEFKKRTFTSNDTSDDVEKQDLVEVEVVPHTVETKAAAAAAAEKENHPFASSLNSILDSDDTDDQKTISIRVNLIRDLAVACIVIIAFILYPSPISNGDNAGMMKSEIDTGMLNRIMPKDITIGKTDINVKRTCKTAVRTADKADLTHAEKIPATAKKETAKTEPTKPSRYYCLVLASRITKSNAAEYVKSLHKKGFKEAKVMSRKKSNKVVYGQYATESEAYNALNELHDNKVFADAWVMKASSKE